MVLIYGNITKLCPVAFSELILGLVIVSSNLVVRVIGSSHRVGGSATLDLYDLNNFIFHYS